MPRYDSYVLHGCIVYSARRCYRRSRRDLAGFDIRPADAARTDAGASSRCRCRPMNDRIRSRAKLFCCSVLRHADAGRGKPALSEWALRLGCTPRRDRADLRVRPPAAGAGYIFATSTSQRAVRSNSWRASQSAVAQNRVRSVRALSMRGTRRLARARAISLMRSSRLARSAVTRCQYRVEAAVAGGFSAAVACFFATSVVLFSKCPGSFPKAYEAEPFDSEQSLASRA